MTIAVFSGDVAIASGASKSNAAGLAVLYPRRPTDSTPYALQPGDHVVIREDDATALDVVLPAWGVDVAADADSVEGVVAPDARVMFEVLAEDGHSVVDTMSARADGAGHVRATSAAIRTAIRAGAAVRATVDADRVRYTFLAMALTVAVDVGRGTISGMATLGSTIAITDERGVLAEADRHRVVLGALGVQRLGEWSVTSPAVATLLAGTRLTVDRHGPMGASEQRGGETVALQIVYRVRQQRAEGHGPPDADLVIAMGKGTRTITSVEAATDANGDFAVDVPESAALAPGSWVRAIYSPSAAFSVQATARWAGLFVPVYGTTVRGAADRPDAPVSCTLFDPSGRLKLEARSRTDLNGSFYCGFLGPYGMVDPELALIQPGDRVEVGVDQGDPIVVRVPNLSAIADVAQSAISGRGIPGAPLQIGWRRGQQTHHLDGAAEADGTFAVSLAADGGIALGDNGSLTVIDDSGNQFVLGWSAVKLTVWLGGQEGDWPTSVDGHAPPGRNVEVTLLDGAGREVGRGRTRTTGSNPNPLDGEHWLVFLADIGGVRYDAAPGDRVHVVAGDQTVDVVVPPLVANLDVAAHALTGRTIPDHTVLIGYGQSHDLTSLSVTSGADGSFEVSGEALKEVLYNDDVWVQVDLDGHTVGRAVPGPGLVVDLDASTIGGWMPGATGVTGSVTRNGRVLCDLAATPGRDATFSAGCRAPNGGAVVPLEAADVIALDGDPRGHLGFTLPTFEVGIDWTDGFVRGTLDGVTHIRMEGTSGVLRNGVGSFLDNIEHDVSGREQLQVPIPSYATFRARLGGAGFRFIGTMPDGNMVVRQDYLPLANVEVAGAAVCGPASPGKRVRIEVASGGNRLGAFEGTVDATGLYNGIVTAYGDGTPVRIAPGQTITMDVDGRPAGTYTVPPLDWTIGRGVAADFSSIVDRLSGTTVPGVEVYGKAPVGDCPSSLNFAANVPAPPMAYWGYLRSGSSGTFSFDLLPGVAGTGVGVALYTDEGLRAYRKQQDVRIVAFPDEGRIEAVGAPLVAGTLIVHRAGLDVARGVVATDAAGLAVLATMPSGVRVGDVISATLGEESDDLTIVPLSVDFSAAAGLIVSARADTAVSTTFVLRDGRSLVVEGRTSAAGAYRLTPGDLSVRSTWRLDDVVSAQVTLAVEDNDVEVVRIDTGGNGSGRQGTVFLPVAYRRPRAR
ncbi:MAG: hypothetical protein ABI780_10520 [Ardenticatenales bacterium]